MNTTHPQGFENRIEAGRQLAALLRPLIADEDALILALPRGGVPIAAEIANATGKPFDVLVVRKLGAPGYEELAMGAIASGGVKVINPEVLAHLKLNQRDVDDVIERETAERDRRETLYRDGRPFPEVGGRTVVIVDDGIATGSTMSAAVKLVRSRNPVRIIVAVPVAPPDSVDRLRSEADEVVTILEPESFTSVSRWYVDFPQTSDDEVRRLLGPH